MSSNLEPWQRLALTSLLTVEVHARDVIRGLLDKEIENSDDFEWTQHLRYNFDDIRDTVMVRQNNAVFEYGFEYLGSTSRLVITPLTGEKITKPYFQFIAPCTTPTTPFKPFSASSS